MPTTINDYYQWALEAAKREIDTTTDFNVVGMSAEEWGEYLVAKYGMEAIMLDESRNEEGDEVETSHTTRGYDIYSNSGPGTVVRQTQVRIKVPVVPSSTLQVIWEHKLSPDTFSLATRYPEFDYDHNQGFISDVVPPDRNAITHAIGAIKASIRAYNQSIVSRYPEFQRQVTTAVHTKRARVQEKHKGLDDLSAAIGIKLTKKSDISQAVPTVPKVRSTVKVLMPPTVKKQERPVLDDATFNGILALIDNQCRQFELTPQSFQLLAEEGLRDVMLSSLNAVYEGTAGGETFQRIGKVDIHLRIAQGEVFVAELKFWGGPASLKEVVTQLLGRLTWRDSHGVAVVLSRNADFTEVLKSIQTTIPTIDGFAAGTLKARAANHFTARFSLPTDKVRQATIHVIVYNLYVAEPPKRVVKRSKAPA